MATETKVDLASLLDNGEFRQLRDTLNEMPALDVADFLDSLEVSKTLLVFRMLSKETAVHVFSMLNTETQQHIVSSISDNEMQSIIDGLWVDDAVDMIEEMPSSLVKKVLRNSSPEIRELINHYLNYPENSVGSIMTAEFVEFKKDMTVGQALASLKNVDYVSETIYTCFITDHTRILEGVVELKTLLFADDETNLFDLIDNDLIVVKTTTEKQQAAKVLMKYDLISLPVVDNENRLVGIVTIDDALDVLIEEDTENIEKMAAITPSEKPYAKTSALILARNRLPWLALSLATNIVVTIVFEIYMPVYSAKMILASFVPMLMGTGGNAGSQTSTTIIRGMAVDDITFKDFFKVIWKELRISSIIGGLLAIISFVRIFFLTTSGDYKIALMVGVSLISAIVVGNLTGVMLPMLAKKLKFDPALMASPLVTTVVDVLTIIVYFSIAMLVFPELRL